MIHLKSVLGNFTDEEAEVYFDFAQKEMLKSFVDKFSKSILLNVNYAHFLANEPDSFIEANAVIDNILATNPSLPV